MISSVRTASSDIFLFHKTSRRAVYDAAYREAIAADCADVLFMNERNEITEGAISNIIIRHGDKYFTPPVECGLLNGVARQQLFQTLPNLAERILTLSDLESADAVYLCNAVRGMREVMVFQR